MMQSEPPHRCTTISTVIKHDSDSVALKEPLVGPKNSKSNTRYFRRTHAPRNQTKQKNSHVSDWTLTRLSMQGLSASLSFPIFKKWAPSLPEMRSSARFTRDSNAPAPDDPATSVRISLPSSWGRDLLPLSEKLIRIKMKKKKMNCRKEREPKPLRTVRAKKKKRTPRREQTNTCRQFKHRLHCRREKKKKTLLSPHTRTLLT